MKVRREAGREGVRGREEGGDGSRLSREGGRQNVRY